MPLLDSAYSGPPAYQYNCHWQTIILSLARRIPPLPYERERLTLSDDDFVDLDWLRIGQQRVVVLTHGLEGDSPRHYIRGAARLFAQHGYDVLAWNCRSCSGEMNRAFRLYNHGEIGDFAEVIQRVLRSGSYREMVLVGYSMGGNINGYHDADGFYAQASAVNFMPGITTPTLLLNAQNDPLLSPECSPVALAEEHPAVFLETPRLGGHVGFMVARDPCTYAERRALAFAQDVL